jgi:hypothetical protein
LFTISYYLDTVETGSLFDLGCALGNHDRRIDGEQDNIVLLDFGEADYDDDIDKYGVQLFNGQGFREMTQIADAAEWFGTGYWSCTGENERSSTVRIGIAINNRGSYIGYAHGTWWGWLVNEVNRRFSEYGYTDQLSAAGAIDIELNWNSPSNTKLWVDGYIVGSSGGYFLYNFGDCAGCPNKYYPNWQPDNNWTQEDVY